MFFPNFVDACSNGYKKEASELYNNNRIGMSDMKRAFRDCCTMSRVGMAKWVLSLEPSLAEMTEFMTETFNYCVEYDVFTSARYILGVRPDIEISDKLFARCCDFGQIEMAKWLLSVKPTIDVSEVAFSRACSSGHLELAQWLVSVNPRIDISANTDQAFREACLFGRLDVVKWLISMKEMDEKVNRRGFDAAYVMEQAEIMKLYYDNRERMVGGGKIIERYGNLVEMYAK